MTTLTLPNGDIENLVVVKSLIHRLLIIATLVRSDPLLLEMEEIRDFFEEDPSSWTDAKWAEFDKMVELPAMAHYTFYKHMLATLLDLALQTDDSQDLDPDLITQLSEDLLTYMIQGDDDNLKLFIETITDV